MRILIITLSLFLTSTYSVFSEEIDLAKMQDFEMTTKTLSSLRQIHEMVSEEFIRNIANSPEVDPRLLNHYEKVIKKMTKQLILEQLDPQFHKSNSQKIKEMLRMEIDWKKVTSFFIEKIRAMKALGKVHGFGFVGAVVLTNVLQIIVPPIVFALAGPVASAISFLALGNGPTVLYYRAVTFFQNQRKLHQFFKGKSNHEKFKNISRRFYETLSIDSIDDLIVPLSHNSLHKYGLKVSNESLVNKMFKLLGFRKNTLDLRALNKFIEEAQIRNGIVKLINNSKILTHSQKSFLLILQLNSIMTIEQSTKFHNHFSRYMVPNTIPEHAYTLTRWVEDAVIKSRSARDILLLIDEIPEESNPMEVIYLWDRVVLPELAKRDKVFGLLEYRRLRETLPALQSEAYLNKKDMMDIDFKNFFKKYVKLSMIKGKKDCFQTHDQVINHLLKSNLYGAY